MKSLDEDSRRGGEHLNRDDRLTMRQNRDPVQGQGNVRHGKLFAENHEAACQRTFGTWEALRHSDARNRFGY